MLNTPRTDRMGRINPNEPHGQKIFVTTAGYQQTYAYDKLVETLCLSLIDPDRYIVMGGSYKIPVMHGLLSEETMREILSSPAYRADQVDREYRSIWSGSMVGAAFNPNIIANLRKIKRAEYKGLSSVVDSDSNTDFYVVSCDVAKDGSANTAVIVGRISIGEYRFNYRFINLFTIDTTDFEIVSNILKETVVKYKAKLLVYDANGVGASLREWLNRETQTQKGEILQGLGIINPPPNSEGSLKKYREKDRNIVYEIKSGGSKASEIHKVFFSRIGNGSIRFLVKSSVALATFGQNKNFALASKNKKDAIMRPYYYTDQMELELKNLDIKDTSDALNSNIIIERRSKNIQKDFFSAGEYLVYAVQQHFELPYYKKKKDQSRQKVVFKATRSNVGIRERRSRTRR